MDKFNDERKYCVYMHTSPSTKKYIGITSVKPVERWGSDGRGYLGKRKNGEFRQPAMARAILKYPNWDEWKHEIIAINLTLEEASRMEQDLITQYQTTDSNYGYNIALGGNCSQLTEEIKQKISASKKGSRASETARLNMSNAQKQRWDEDARTIASERNSGSGNPMYGVHRYGEQAPMFGKNQSEETKEKISKAKRGKNNPCSKPVICIETGVVYDSAGEAGRSTGIKNQTILACCNHKPHRKTAGKLHWEFYDIYEKQEEGVLCVSSV